MRREIISKKKAKIQAGSQKPGLLLDAKPSSLGKRADGRGKAYGWRDHVSEFASCVGTARERRMREESWMGG